MRAFVAIRQQIANPILFCRHVFLQNGSSKYHQSPSYVVFSFHLLYITKLLQKREMRKDIVIELSYKGFSRASDYS